MLTLLKLTKKIECEKGFSLMEVLVSTLILAAVAVATYQVLPYPKQRVIELEQRADIVRYMDKKMAEYKDATTLSATSTVFCSAKTLCDMNVCGATVCADSNFTGCTTFDPILPAPTGPTGLSEIVSNHKTMCFIQVVLDPTTRCSSDNTSSDAKQVCMFAKWPKKQKAGDFNYETLTAFVFKP